MNQRHLRRLHGWSFVLLLCFSSGLISLYFTIGLIFFCFVMELVSFVSVSLLLIAHLREWHTDTETQSQSHTNTVLNEYCTSNCNTHTLHTSNLFDKPFILVLFFLFSLSREFVCFSVHFVFFFWPNTFAPLLLYFIGNIHFTQTHTHTHAQ